MFEHLQEKFFRGDKSRIMNHIIREYPKMKTITHISSILNFELDYYYSNKIEEYNAIFGQQQIGNINTTLSLISCKNKNERLETLKKNHVQKSIQWCDRNNISYNKTANPTNIFLN